MQDGNGHTYLSDTELVKLAYTMAVGPHRFEKMSRQLLDRLEQITGSDVPVGADGVPDAMASEAFEPLVQHFEGAFALVEAQGRRFDSFPSSVRVMEATDTPVILLRPNGFVQRSNAAAKAQIGIVDGSVIDADLFQHGHADRLLADLNHLEDFDSDKIISIYNVIDKDTDQNIRMALTRTLDFEGDTVGHLAAIHVGWSQDLAAHFGEAFDLTDTELAVTRAIVSGQTLADLAEERGRSIHTVRNQLKALLAKLALKSQTELACLYAGYVKLNVRYRHNEETRSTPLDVERTEHALPRANGRQLTYELFGNPKGRPVVLFPSMLGGNTITDAMARAVQRHNLRLIIIWRPGFSQSTVDGPPDRAAFETYANDVSDLQDTLNVTKATMVGTMTTAMWAYACAKYVPDRVISVLQVNGVTPTWRGPHAKLISGLERLRLFLARHVPNVGMTVIRGFISRVDAGYDHEVVSNLLNGIEPDLETIEDPEIRHKFRNAYLQTTRQGMLGFVRELKLYASDWHFLTENLDAPVHYITGEENMVYREPVIKAYTQHLTNHTYEIVPATGHLMLYQATDLVFDRIAAASVSNAARAQ